MFYRFAVTAAFVLAVFSAAGCKPRVKQYQLHGQIMHLDPQGDVAAVKHGDIPGFMSAMTMSYRVPDNHVFSTLKVGDVIDANLTVLPNGSDYWLENVRVTGTAPVPATDGGDVRPQAPVAFPDIELVNQDNKKFRLSDFKGKALLITFIYTRCPMPNFCPRLSSQFAKIEADLKSRPEAFDRTHLVTVSIDPAYDTPAVLRKYGLAYLSNDPSGFAYWDFACAAPSDLKRLADAFGLLYIEEDNQISHSMCIILIGPDGRISKSWATDWTTSELENDLLKAASVSVKTVNG